MKAAQSLIRRSRLVPRSLPQTSPLLSRFRFPYSFIPCRRLVESAKPNRVDTIKTPFPQPTSKTNTPSYQIEFTCKPCGFRSRHNISKQGYHSGSVLVTCPSCKNRHVISDHLKVFSDVSVTIEELMRAKGELVKRGTVTEDGHIELFKDGGEPKLPPPPESHLNTSPTVKKEA